MGKVIIRGVSINYRTLGQGEDVVLIHGLAANQGFWSPAVLMPLVRKYRVTLLDLRGHGHSSMPVDGYSSRELAGDLQALFQYLGISNATLIGHSYGGVVALHSAVLYPESVARLVLADTRIRAFQPHLSSQEVLENRQFAAKMKMLGLELPEGEQETGLWLLEQLAMPEWRQKAELFQRARVFMPFAGWNGNKSTRAADRWLELMRNTSAKKDFQEIGGLTRERIGTMNKPLFVLCGGNSNAVRTLEALKVTLPSCQTAIIPDVGHFFPLTHPGQFVNKLMGFLQYSRTKEKRFHRRFATDLPISMQHKIFQANLARMINVSLAGMMLESDLQLTVGNEISITAKAPGSSNIVLAGEIIRVMPVSGPERYMYGIRCLTQNEQGRDWKKLVETVMQQADTKDFRQDVALR